MIVVLFSCFSRFAIVVFVSVVVVVVVAATCVLLLSCVCECECECVSVAKRAQALDRATTRGYLLQLVVQHVLRNHVRKQWVCSLWEGAKGPHRGEIV